MAPGAYYAHSALPRGDEAHFFFGRMIDVGRDWPLSQVVGVDLAPLDRQGYPFHLIVNGSDMGIY